MSEERTQYRVIQNGNPFEDAQRLIGRPFTVVVDGGANVGDVTQHLLANYPRAEVHALEPDPDSFEELRRRFSAEPRVVARRVGLSNVREDRSLFRYAESGLNSLLPLGAGTDDYLDGYGTELVGEAVVPLVTLDEYSDLNTIHEIDLLKLDLQGWEIACLEGSRRLFEQDRIRAVYVEVNFVELYEGQIYFDDVAQWLKQFDFTWQNHYALSFNREGVLCWADALFVRQLQVHRPDTSAGPVQR